MRNRKSTSLILATLLGLIVVVGVGAWLMMGDSDARPAVVKPVKPGAEISR